MTINDNDAAAAEVLTIQFGNITLNGIRQSPGQHFQAAAQGKLTEYCRLVEPPPPRWGSEPSSLQRGKWFRSATNIFQEDPWLRLQQPAFRKIRIPEFVSAPLETHHHSY